MAAPDHRSTKAVTRCWHTPMAAPAVVIGAQHGGFRKAAGRPKGSRNRATIAREARQREALGAGPQGAANGRSPDVLVHFVGRRPALDEAADHIELPFRPTAAA
jgi:hypothetical protein